MKHADALSRLRIHTDVEYLSDSNNSIHDFEYNVHAISRRNSVENDEKNEPLKIEFKPFTTENILEKQLRDPELNDIIIKLKLGKEENSNVFLDSDGILCKKHAMPSGRTVKVIYLPKDLISDALYHCHSTIFSGHKSYHQ